MLVLKPLQKVKFICGFIYSNKNFYQKAKKLMGAKFGRIDFESQVINFNLTNYYTEEMGKPLFRRFVSFYKLRNSNSEEITKIKLFCMKVEKILSLDNKRQINIDPGYLNLAKLILLTTKDFSHRIHLKKGIYAEVTLYYAKKKFNDLIWTYPDYRTNEYKDIFLKIRDIYRKQIKVTSL